MFQSWSISVPKQEQLHFICRGLEFQYFVFGGMACFCSIPCHFEYGSKRKTHVSPPMTVHCNRSSNFGCVSARNPQIPVTEYVCVPLLAVLYPPCKDFVVAKVIVDDGNTYSLSTQILLTVIHLFSLISTISLQWSSVSDADGWPDHSLSSVAY